MRGTVPGLTSPAPLGHLMPAVFQDDPFTMRLTDGLDDILAPVLTLLDCLPAYIDPLLAPEDFMAWLATWFDVALDENWPSERQRSMLAHIVELYRWRGTPAGLRRQLELATGGTVEITDGGAVTTSTKPGTALPGDPAADVAILIRVDDPDALDLTALEAIVRACKPAHIQHRIEVEPA